MKRQLWMVWCGGAFGLVAILHLIRIAAGWPLVVGPWSVPLEVSSILWPCAAMASAGLTLGARLWRAPAARPSRMPPLETLVGEDAPTPAPAGVASAVGLHYHLVDEDDDAE